MYRGVDPGAQFSDVLMVKQELYTTEVHVEATVQALVLIAKLMHTVLDIERGVMRPPPPPPPPTGINHVEVMDD